MWFNLIKESAIDDPAPPRVANGYMYHISGN